MSASKMIVGIALNATIFGAALFLPAGTVRWPRAWAFLLVVVACATASTAALNRAGGAVLEERFKPPLQKGQPPADKLLVVALIASFIGLLVFIPLDVRRFHLLPRPGTAVSILGLALFIAGWRLMTAALTENAFAVAVVRYQKERNQTVVDTGPYAVVRHPMYAAVFPLCAGMALWLESYAAALLTAALAAILVARIFVEERLLARELPGYGAYMKRVRWRMIPRVW